MEEEEKKQTITLDANGFIDKKMGKAEFWIRFVLWLGLAVIAPFAYICVSFGIFESKDTTTTLSGWGVIAVIFLCIMLLIVVNNVRKGLPYGNFFRQCIDGIFTLIPLVGAILILEVIKTRVESFERFLIFTAACEFVAIPINPFPKWISQNEIEKKGNFLTKIIRNAIGKED